MYHFFVSPSQIGEKEIYIEGKDVNHIKNVLRMKIGEELSVGNGIDGNEYRCSVAAFEEDRVILKIHFIKQDGVEAPAEICLFQGLPKNDKMELIIQKIDSSHIEEAMKKYDGIKERFIVNGTKDGWISFDEEYVKYPDTLERIPSKVDDDMLLYF